MKNRGFIKKQDVLLIAGVIILAAVLYFPKLIDTQGLCAHIYVDGSEYLAVNLEETDTEYSFTLPVEPEILIRVGKAYICVESAECPDKVCVKAGSLDKNGDVAACVPSGVLIIVKAKDSSEVDVIA